MCGLIVKILIEQNNKIVGFNQKILPILSLKQKLSMCYLSSIYASLFLFLVFSYETKRKLAFKMLFWGHILFLCV
jgi:hypothetical protein